METNESNDAQLEGTGNSSADHMSRRDFVERLRRTAMFVAPMVAAVALMTPNAKGY